MFGLRSSSTVQREDEEVRVIEEVMRDLWLTNVQNGSIRSQMNGNGDALHDLKVWSKSKHDQRQSIAVWTYLDTKSTTL